MASPIHVVLAGALLVGAAPSPPQSGEDACRPILVVAPAHEPPAPGATAADGAADDGSLVDVLFVFTPAASAAAGGAAAMAAQLESHVAYTNAAYLASDVAQRVRLVHAEQVAYVTSGSIITDVQRLKDPGDGFLDEVHPLRDAHAADLVCLIVNSASAGTAFQMQTLSPGFEDSAFAVIAVNVAGDVFAHEAGHIMGLGHDNVPGATAVSCYAFGHKTSGPEVFRTIMAGPPGIKLDVFSNPDLQHAGQPLGIDGTGCPPGAADSARARRDRRDGGELPRQRRWRQRPARRRRRAARRPRRAAPGRALDAGPRLRGPGRAERRGPVGARGVVLRSDVHAGALQGRDAAGLPVPADAVRDDQRCRHLAARLVELPRRPARHAAHDPGRDRGRRCSVRRGPQQRGRRRDTLIDGDAQAGSFR